MSLPEAWTAPIVTSSPANADGYLQYEEWDGDEAASYHSYLITGARAYREELSALYGTYAGGGMWAYNAGGAGVVWAAGDYVEFAGWVSNIASAKFAFKRWSVNRRTGADAWSDNRQLRIRGSSLITPNDYLYTAEPDTGAPGRVWRYGQDDTTNHGGPVPIYWGAEYQDNSVGGLEAASAIEPGTYGLASYPVDFAIDTKNDRIFWRMIGDDVGRVRMHRLSSPYTAIANLYVPSSTAGIMPTGDGYVWVADDYGWLVCYDLDGNLVATMRNPISGTPPSGGRVYGWDARGGRFLCVDCTASHSSGASRLKVRAFRATPQPGYLVAPVPLTPARENGTQRVCTHLCSDGGVPSASRLVRANASISLGIAETDRVTDVDGDATFAIAPAAAGSHDLDLETVT
jgi:hypothetical protein